MPTPATATFIFIAIPLGYPGLILREVVYFTRPEGSISLNCKERILPHLKLMTHYLLTVCSYLSSYHLNINAMDSQEIFA